MSTATEIPKGDVATRDPARPAVRDRRWHLLVYALDHSEIIYNQRGFFTAESALRHLQARLASVIVGRLGISIQLFEEEFNATR